MFNNVLKNATAAAKSATAIAQKTATKLQADLSELKRADSSLQGYIHIIYYLYYNMYI